MTKPPAPPSEQEHHRKAFELYASQGGSRSYQKVAEALNVSVASVKQWGRTFGWRQRLRERDAEATRQIADRPAHSGLDDRSRDLKIIHMAKMKLTRDIAEGKVKGKIPDLEMLIRLEEYLADSQEDSITSLLRRLPDELREPITEAIRKRLLPLVAPQSIPGGKHDETPNADP